MCELLTVSGEASGVMSHMPQCHFMQQRPLTCCRSLVTKVVSCAGVGHEDNLLPCPQCHDHDLMLTFSAASPL